MNFFAKIGWLISWLLTTGLSVSCSSQSKEKIWIDTDIAIGKWGRDVDDGLALIMALRSPKVDIEGISLVSDVEYGYKITSRLLEWYGDGKNIPVYKGASNCSGLPLANAATMALTQALRTEKMTIIALGPVTNIATVLQLHPELVWQIKRIVWCAGRRPNMHFRPGNGIVNVCDCNFEKDPEAAQDLLSSGVKLVLTGYEASSHIHLSKKDLQPLEKSPFNGDRWLYKKLINWYTIWRIFLGSKEGFIPFDAVTMGCFLFPKCMRSFQNIPVAIETAENDSRMPFKEPLKQYLVASFQLKTSRNADYYYWAGDSLKLAMLQMLLQNQTEESSEVAHHGQRN